MGLDIVNYSASYGTLQIFRELAAKKENKNLQEIYSRRVNTKYPEFIHHSDCEGGYISTSFFGINQLPESAREGLFWGDLDALKKELEDLYEYMKQNLDEATMSQFQDFYDDITEEETVIIFN